MAHFKRDYHELFLGVIRKYMQVRGPMSQKDLAEIIEVGVSTVSRFLNQKTRELDPQLIAKIVAKLNIPLHEVIDFVEEDYGERFIKLVKYLKDEVPAVDDKTGTIPAFEDVLASPNIKKNDGSVEEIRENRENYEEDEDNIMSEKRRGPSIKEVKSPPPMKEKLGQLSPRQKAYLTDFLDLDVEGKDLVVDVGNSLLRYFKQRGVEF